MQTQNVHNNILPWAYISNNSAHFSISWLMNSKNSPCNVLPIATDKRKNDNRRPLIWLSCRDVAQWYSLNKAKVNFHEGNCTVLSPFSPYPLCCHCHGDKQTFRTLLPFPTNQCFWSLGTTMFQESKGTKTLKEWTASREAFITKKRKIEGCHSLKTFLNETQSAVRLSRKIQCSHYSPVSAFQLCIRKSATFSNLSHYIK